MRPASARSRGGAPRRCAGEPCKTSSVKSASSRARAKEHYAGIERVDRVDLAADIFVRLAEQLIEQLLDVEEALRELNLVAEFLPAVAEAVVVPILLLVRLFARFHIGDAFVV